MSIDRSSSPPPGTPRSPARRIAASIGLPLVLGLGADVLLWAIPDAVSRPDIAGGWLAIVLN